MLGLLQDDRGFFCAGPPPEKKSKAHPQHNLRISDYDIGSVSKDLSLILFSRPWGFELLHAYIMLDNWTTHVVLWFNGLTHT